MNNCPKCGKENPMQPHPTLTGRVIMLCNCNPYGPVLETNAVSAELLDIGFNHEAEQALMTMGVYDGNGVSRLSDETLLSLPGIGPATLTKIRAIFAQEE